MQIKILNHMHIFY